MPSRKPFDTSPDGRPFMSCYECSGRWMGMYVGYDHEKTCSRARPRPYAVAEQDRHEAEAKKEEAPCPVHGCVPAIECSACADLADTDWGDDGIPAWIGYQGDSL